MKGYKARIVFAAATIALAAAEPKFRTDNGSIILDVASGKHVQLKIGDSEPVNIGADAMTLRARIDNEITPQLATVEACCSQNTDSVTALEDRATDLEAANSQLTAQLSTANSQLTAMSDLVAPLRNTNLTALAALNLTTIQAGVDEAIAEAAGRTALLAACDGRIKWVRFRGSDGTIFGQAGIDQVRKVGIGRYEILFSSEVEGGRYAVSAMSTYSSASNVKANLADERFLQDSLHQSDHLANSGSTARFLEIFKPDRTYIQTRSMGGAYADAPFVNVMVVSNNGALQASCAQSLEGLHYVVWDGTRNPGPRWAESPGMSVGARDSWGGTLITGQFQDRSGFSAAGNVVGGREGYYMGFEGSASGTYNKWTSTYFNPGSRKNGNPQGILRTALSVIAFDRRLHAAAPNNTKFLTWGDTSNSIVGNAGVRSVVKLSTGTWRITWTTPFSNAHYVVTGLANMRCTNGMHLGIADAAGSQTAQWTTIQSRDYAGNLASHSNACTFNTILAVGV